MTRRYTYATCLSFGGDTPTAEFEVEVSYLVYWGAPETPPSYSHGGLPADPDELDDVRVETVDGKPAPWMPYASGPGSDAELVDAILTALDSDEHRCAMMMEAREEATADYYDAMERRWEERAERAQ